MQKAINYAPYVYACRTSLDDVTTVHVFTLIPIPKSKSIHFFHKSTLGIDRGISIEENTLGIHLESKRSRTEFGDKIVSNNQTFWAGYISFEYSGIDNMPDDNYEYSINVHKNKDGQPKKAIKIIYKDIETLSQVDFNELKDGDFALACPYAYLYQKEVRKQITFFPQVLIPALEKYADTPPFESNRTEEGTTLILPTRMVTSASITIQTVNTTSQEASIEVSSEDDNNAHSLTVDYASKQFLSRSPGQRKKKKMKVRVKGSSM